ncbi:MAG: cysteine desulfurase [Lachnospiraceae bacterium]|nr:cysteine desulfurase [Lachnospiraceae bacterium]
MIYVDHAATTPLRAEAKEAMLSAMEYFGNPSSMHKAGQEARGLLGSLRETLAGLLNCSPREVIFTSGGTESDNMALRAAAIEGKKLGKTHMVISAIEHHAVLHTAYALEQEGFQITYVKPGRDGIVSSESIEQALREDTILVSLMYANNETGMIQPVEEVARLCQKKKILFHVDAVQALGHVPMALDVLGADYVAFSAHKFGGPRGIGGLYVKKTAPLYSFMQGGSQERGKRAGTENLPAIAGMVKALEVSLRNLEEDRKRIEYLRDQFIDTLSEIEGVTLNGKMEGRLPGNANFCFHGASAESLLMMLSEKEICVSTGAACAAGALEPSHVLLAMGLTKEEAGSSLRFSFGSEMTDAELDILVESVLQVYAAQAGKR